MIRQFSVLRLNILSSARKIITALKQVIEAHDLLSHPKVNGRQVADLLHAYGASEISVETVQDERGSTDFVSCLVPGENRSAPTLGVSGRARLCRPCLRTRTVTVRSSLTVLFMISMLLIRTLQIG